MNAVVNLTIDAMRARGLGHGWDAANFADAYGSDESPQREAARRSRVPGRPWQHRAAYREGFMDGWAHFERGEWPDGLSREEF